MPEIEIRPATSADITAVIKLEHNSLTTHVWQMERQLEEDQLAINFREVRLPRPVHLAYPRSPEQFQMEWKHRSAVLVAVLDAVPVAYLAMMEQEAPASAWITDLVVGERFRRKGIASGLLMAASDWAAHRKLRRLVLEMQSKNHPATRMAIKNGFEFCGYNDHYYGNQDIALFYARYLR
jgi:GNAT superfamily N-acetyltransferase